MVEKAIWLNIALMCCIFTHLRLVKIQPHTSAILPSQPYCLLSHQIIYMYRGSGGVPQEKFGILNSDFDAIQEVKSHIFKLPLPKTPAPPHQKKIKGLTKIFVKSFPSKTSLD